MRTGAENALRMVSTKYDEIIETLFLIGVHNFSKKVKIAQKLVSRATFWDESNLTVFQLIFSLSHNERPNVKVTHGCTTFLVRSVHDAWKGGGISFFGCDF